MISRAPEHFLHILTGVVGFISVETITAAETEAAIKILCQVIITAATVYSILKKKK